LLRVLIAVVSIACVLVVAWAVRTLRDGPIPEPEPHVNRLVVFPFQVRGQDEFQYLGAAMVDLLTTKLDGAGPLYCVDAHTTLSALSRQGLDMVTPASAREVASGFGASIYIMGSIVEMGEDVQLNAMLFETGAENGPTATASVQGDVDELPALVDGLAMKLLEAHVSETEGELPEIAARTTDSLPALKAYLQGQQLSREGRFLEAVESYQRAVQADSTFALAWLALSGTVNASPRASSAGIDDAHALEQAKRFSSKLPAKLRLEMEAGELGGIWRGCPSSADAKRSVSLRRRILINHPNDAALWGALGVHLRWWAPMWGQPMDQAREALERSLALENNYFAVAYLSDIYAIEGNEAKFDSLWRHVDTSEWSEDHDFSFEDRLEAAFYEGDSRAQAEVMAELEAYIDSPFRMVTSMYTVARGSVWPFVRNVISEDVPALWTKSDGPATRAFSHLCLALLRGSRGQWQSARSQFESARSSHDGYALLVEALATMAPMREVPRSRLQALDSTLETASEETLRFPHSREDSQGYAEMRRLFVRGLLAVRLGKLERAFAFAQRLEQSAASWEGVNVRPPTELEVQMFARIVRGEAMAAQGHLEDALDELNECTPYLPRAFTRMFGDMALGLLRYRRAELSQELGRAHEALRWYDTICMAQMSMFHEVPFLAPSCFQRARVYDELGYYARALRYYSEFLDLWKECDPELEIWVQTARSRVADLRSMGT
jgi:tetratricopeptide (TPR) repeat protein